MSAQETPGFSDIEALKMAEGMEKEGLAFYAAAEAAVDADELKSTFRTLADEERKHLKIFEDMAGELASAKSEEYWDDPDVGSYIRAVVSRRIFPRPDLAAGTISDMSGAADAFRFALQAEKDTVLFYNLCADHARGKDVRDAFYRLAKEERKHVALMGRLLKEAGG